MMRRLLKSARELAASRAADGPYRFLVRRWDDVSDIELALRVLETEFFREELKPLALPVTGVTSILVIAPHQDDETIGAGGALLLAAAAGAKIDILYITDGASRTPAFAGKNAEYVQLRDAEARAVCDKLGARMHQIGVSNTHPKPTVDDLEKLSATIRDLAPQVVMAPWVLDSPPMHRLCNHMLWLADRVAPLPAFELWGYQTANTLPPNGYVDITSVAQAKRELLELFHSQNDYFLRYDHVAMGLAAWNQRFVAGTTARYIETFFTLPSAEALSMIGRLYPQDLAITYRKHHAALPAMAALHAQVAGSWRAHLRQAVRRVRRP
jgi:LmbE family N-acetylglucosaminyl deacetylase